MAIGRPGSLYIGSIIVSMCYGVRASMVLVTAELFDLKYYSLNYNIVSLNLPLGTFLFSGLLARYLYDAQTTKNETGANICTGAHCYRLVFVIMAIACAIGFGLEVILVLRTRKLYLLESFILVFTQTRKKTLQ